MNQYIVTCPVLAIASWRTYRFLRYQVTWSGLPISLRIFYSLLWSTQSKALVSEAKVVVFLELSCFFCDPTGASNSISGSSAFSNSSLYIWKFSVHVLMKPSLKNFEHYFASMWNEPSGVGDETFLCPYGNLVKEGTFLKSAKAASNPQRDKIRWRISRTQCLKIGKRKMWVIFCISIMFIIALFHFVKQFVLLYWNGYIFMNFNL